MGQGLSGQQAARGEATQGQTAPEVLGRVTLPRSPFIASRGHGREDRGRGLPRRPHHCAFSKGRQTYTSALRKPTPALRPLLLTHCCPPPPTSFKLVTYFAFRRPHRCPRRRAFFPLSGPARGPRIFPVCCRHGQGLGGSQLLFNCPIKSPLAVTSKLS